MPPIANVGSQTHCTFSTGNAPMGGIPVPGQSVFIEGKPALTIADNIPMLNIMPMQMCLSPMNPTGMGKPTPPGPSPTACIPIIVSPWAPPVAPFKLVNGKPILLPGSTCKCVWNGDIQVVVPGAIRTQAQ